MGRFERETYRLTRRIRILLPSRFSHTRNLCCRITTNWALENKKRNKFKTKIKVRLSNVKNNVSQIYSRDVEYLHKIMSYNHDNILLS